MGAQNLLYADTRKAQEADNCIQVTIPKDLVERFDISGQDDILFVYEGGESFEVRPPE